MLSSFKVANYRGFKSFELADLSAVNLIVGKNNSGKTALLEAIHFLASGGNPMVLTGSASRRGEYVLGGRDEGPPLTDISHFFHGHEIRAGTAFTVSCLNELPPVTVKTIDADEVDPELIFDLVDAASRRQRNLWDSGDRPALAMKIEGGRARRSDTDTFLLSENGGLVIDPRRLSFVRRMREDMRDAPTVLFICPDAGESESLAQMWDVVLRDKRESEIVEAMQILEPGLLDIMFQAAERSSRRYLSRSSVLVGFAGDPKRVPLGSMGDGMRRLLELSLSLSHASGGFLLVDEVDTGFHYSIMAKMWELVVKTALNSNIQVFATTHSADCVRGLGAFCKQSPDLCSNVTAHKIERDLERSINFSGADVLSAVEQDIEIR